MSPESTPASVPVQDTGLKLVTLILPAYNEAALLEANLGTIMRYLDTLASRYRFEVLVINDGSRDATGRIAESVAEQHPSMQVVHHPTNFGLGQALRTGFALSRGDMVVTLDADLSYAPETVGQLLEALETQHARLALASAYMEGGRTTAVPASRLWLSRTANRWISLITGRKLSTFTCMVRAHEGPFIRTLEPRSSNMAVMPEVIYKAMILGAKIVEVPAHLDWTLQRGQAAQSVTPSQSAMQSALEPSQQTAAQSQPAARRSSSMRILSHIVSTTITGFLFRPFLLMLIPGLLVGLFSLYVNLWLVMDFVGALKRSPGLGEAAALVYAERPATLLIGLLTMILAIQLVSLGGLSLQVKKYFEEQYYQMVKLRRQMREELKLDKPGLQDVQSLLWQRQRKDLPDQ